MDNSFALKNTIMRNLESGNIFMDVIFGTLVCSLITSITGLLNLRDIINFIKCIRLFRHNGSSIFMEYKHNKLSDTFKGILYFIDKKKLLSIKNLKEEREFKYCYKTENTTEYLIYLPQNNEIYEIDEDIFIEISNREKKIESGRNEIYEDMISLNIFSKTKTIEHLKDFVDKCKNEYNEYITNMILNNQSLFNCTYDPSEKNLIVTKINFETNRTFNNLFFDQKNDLLKKVDNFINGKDWYNSKGIPYTLGILLYGDPGCGKTSFIKALLKYVDKNKTKKAHGIYVNLHDSFDFDELEKIISNERLGEFDIPLDRRLYIFEDIDCMGNLVKDRDLIEQEKNRQKKALNNLVNTSLKKKSKDNESDSGSDSDGFDISTIGPKVSNYKDKKNSLSRLLNILDGIIETPGRIIIMTTNKKDILDKALIRPGRIDIQINFTKCSKEMTKDIINNFYNSSLTINDVENITEFSLTPAELIQKCFENDTPFDLLK